MLDLATMTDENNVDDTQTTVYELGYHMLPTIVADDLEKEVGTIRSAIEKRGGSFIAEGSPETVELEYAMAINNGGKKTKYDKAYFGWMKFELDPEQATALQADDLASNAQILRSSLVKTTREETRAQLQTAQHTVLREVKNTGTLEKRHDVEEGGEVSEEELAKSIDELVGETKE